MPPEGIKFLCLILLLFPIFFHLFPYFICLFDHSFLILFSFFIFIFILPPLVAVVVA